MSVHITFLVFHALRNEASTFFARFRDVVSALSTRLTSSHLDMEDHNCRPVLVRDENMSSAEDKDYTPRRPSNMAVSSDSGQKRARKRVKSVEDEWEDVEELLSNTDGIIANMDLKVFSHSYIVFFCATCV